MKTDITKDLNYYRKLPYEISLRPEDSVWIAKIEELEGCVAHGSTPSEALAILDEIKTAWIESALEAGDSIPEPTSIEVLPSGKWVQRVPKSLHKKLTALAKKEEVSLNQLVTAVLAEAVGAKFGTKTPELATSPSISPGGFASNTQDQWQIHQPAAKSVLSFLDALHFARSLESKKPETKETRHEIKKEHAYNA